MATLLIHDALIVTQDRERRIVRGHVRAEDGIVTHVGEAPTNADRTIDGRGKVVLPGLVNAHTHAAMTLLRGLADDLPLETWLRERIWPAEKALTREAVSAGSELAILEMLAAGVTSFNDMYFFPDATAEAVDRAGMRATLATPFLDTPTPELSPEEMAPFARAFAGRWRGHSRIQTALAPHATYTVAPSGLRAIAALHREMGGIIHTHCCETRFEVYDVEARHGKRPLALLEEAGLVGPTTVLAHCGWITKEEVRRIAAADATAVHCPVSNMKLATGGFMPLTELWEARANVALGTDGAASNNTLDVLETAKFSALIEKHHRWDASAAPAQRVLDAATLGGARALALENALGSIEAGKSADLAIFDFAKPHLFPLHDVVSHLVYAASGRDTHATIVGGKVLYEDGNFETLNANGVLRRAQDVAQRLTE